MKIPEQTIEEIRQKSDIVELIGETVRLKKSGRGYTGLCPFHSEKTPSFHVNQERGIYKCFGCGKGGNVITFMMEYFSLSFVEAAKGLAERAGIIIEEEDADTEKRDRYEAAYAVLKTAAAYYNSLLEKPAGSEAKKYFQERQFSAELSREFMLGFAPDAWDATLKFLTNEKKFSLAAIEDAGLIIKRDDGGFYDRFRGRAMFPIFDQIGRVVGFGARRMNEDKNQPKYINSPQSLVYDKSRVLYGIFQGKKEIREKNFAILTEGYADALTLHQAGFSNTIASSGTALTREQLQLLYRLCKSLYIVYDADAAGINAAMRGIDLALEEGFEVRVIELPKGEDPDSFVRKHGTQAFELRIRDAHSFIEFQARTLEAQGLFASPEKQAEAIRILVNSIAKIRDPLTRNLIIPTIAAKFRLRDEVLFEELQRIILPQVQQPRQYRTPQRIENYARPEPSGEIAAIEKKNLYLEPEEKEIFRLILTAEGMAAEIFADLTERVFFTDHGKKLFRLLKESFEKKSDPFAHPELQPDESEFLSALVFKRLAPSERWKDYDVEIPPEDSHRILSDTIRGLRKAEIEREIRELREFIGSLNGERDPEKEQQLLRLFHELEALKKNYETESEDEVIS